MSTRRTVTSSGKSHGIKAVKTTTSSSGIKYWWKGAKFHREDGPAIEYGNGDVAWYFEGNLHREDGPAIEWVSGYKVWYRHGVRHREDGPAVDDGEFYREWVIEGKTIVIWKKALA
jgi:hypothetical protein